MKTISRLEEELSSLKSELDRVNKSFKMLNNGTDSLDEILQVRRVTKDMRDIGFNEKETYASNLTHSSSKPKMLNQMFQHQGKGKVNDTKKKFQHWRCHHCG